jgi:aryl-alcohol dehydrogenase-like predicted oxidoreductase
MEYRKLGQSGLTVSALCLGTMTFGDRTDETEAKRIVGAAAEAGVNFIDTADQYAKGESERVTGKAIAANRHHWILATKVGNRMGPGIGEVGLSRRWMMQAIENSLRRLGIDCVDIYYLHYDDTETPLEETLGAIGDIIRAGKARYFGISNYRGWRISLLMQLCKEFGVPRPVVCQPYYNAMNRQPEVEILPACQYFGLGVAAYSPLARGVLTGKYKPGQPPPADTRAGRKDARMLETEFRPESLVAAQEIVAHAAKKGMSSAQFAINWALNNSLVSSAITGPRTLDQWNEYEASLKFKLDAEDEALIDRLVRPGHPSSPGYSDPRYPIYGRIVKSAAG